jgi:hypothetical protein
MSGYPSTETDLRAKCDREEQWCVFAYHQRREEKKNRYFMRQCSIHQENSGAKSHRMTNVVTLV